MRCIVCSLSIIGAPLTSYLPTCFEGGSAWVDAGEAAAPAKASSSFLGLRSQRAHAIPPTLTHRRHGNAADQWCESIDGGHGVRPLLISSSKRVGFLKRTAVRALPIESCAHREASIEPFERH